MDVLNEIVFEVVKEEDRKYRFTIPVDAPLGEAYEVAGGFMNEIVRLIKEHNEKVQKLTKENEEQKEEA